MTDELDELARDMTANEYRAELTYAGLVLRRWARSAGFELTAGASLVQLVVSMRDQHCDERSYADLRASGGIEGATHVDRKNAEAELRSAEADIERLTRERDEARRIIGSIGQAIICTEMGAEITLDFFGEDISVEGMWDALLNATNGVHPDDIEATQ